MHDLYHGLTTIAIPPPALRLPPRLPPQSLSPQASALPRHAIVVRRGEREGGSPLKFGRRGDLSTATPPVLVTACTARRYGPNCPKQIARVRFSVPLLFTFYCRSGSHLSAREGRSLLHCDSLGSAFQPFSLSALRPPTCAIRRSLFFVLHFPTPPNLPPNAAREPRHTKTQPAATGEQEEGTRQPTPSASPSLTCRVFRRHATRGTRRGSGPSAHR